MAGDVDLRIEGLDDLRRVLSELPAKLRKRALRNALAAGARIVRDASRLAAPKLSQSTKERTAGLVRKSIVVRTSKQSRRDGDVGVFVNVRPAKGAVRGAKSPLDPYYWRWLEFGWNPAGRDRSKAGKATRRKLNRAAAPKKHPGFGFLQKGAQHLGDALKAFERVLGPQIQKLNSNPKDPL